MERSPTNRRQVRLTIFENEPLARLAEQRLRQENIPCVVRSLGAGPVQLGASYQPHTIYVKVGDEMGAREVLNLVPAEIAEREGSAAPSVYHPSVIVVVLLVVVAASLIFGTLELLVNRILR